MTPHVGCFEILPVWLAGTHYEKTGRRITILYRPPRKEILRAVVGEARQAPGIEAVPTNLAGVKHVIRSLRNGNTFGALPDQVPSNGEGVWADFFGRPAYTMTLPVRVAKQFNAVRIFAWGVREKNGWRIEAEEWDSKLTGDMARDVEDMNRMIEGIIRFISSTSLNSMPGATTAISARKAHRRRMRRGLKETRSEFAESTFVARMGAAR